MYSIHGRLLILSSLMRQPRHACGRPAIVVQSFRPFRAQLMGRYRGNAGGRDISAVDVRGS